MLFRGAEQKGDDSGLFKLVKAEADETFYIVLIPGHEARYKREAFPTT